MSSSEAAHNPIFATLKGRDRDKVLGNATQRTYAPGRDPRRGGRAVREPVLHR